MGGRNSLHCHNSLGALCCEQAVQLIIKCTCTHGWGRRMGTTFQPSSFPHAKPGETFPVDQHWAASVWVSSLTSLSSISIAVVQSLVLLSLTQVCIFHYQVFKQPWPGIMRTLYGNHQQFETTYFKKFPGYYVTGDGKVVWEVRGCRGLGTAI